MEDYTAVYCLACRIKPILTQRQFECLFLARAGYTNKAIGNKLYITPAAVKKNFGDMEARLHVKTKMQVLDAFYLELLEIINDYIKELYNISILKILQSYKLF